MPTKITVSAGCKGCPFFICMEATASSDDICGHPALGEETLILTNLTEHPAVTPAACPGRTHPLFELQIEGVAEEGSD